MIVKNLPPLTVKFSTPTWVHHNQLFQRHPRLLLLEEQCSKTFHNLKQLISYVFVSGLHRNSFVMSRLLYTALIELGDTSGVESEFGVGLFYQIRKPNIFSWNTMIRYYGAFGGSRSSGMAVRYYMEMLSHEMVPDRYTFPFLLQACGATSDLHLVEEVHCHVMKLGFHSDLFALNCLLNAYLVSGSTIEAWILFDEMAEKDIISWTSLISGLVSLSKDREALLVFKRLMVDDCVPCPNLVTMVSTMSACGNLGSVTLMKCMHSLLEKAGWVESDTSVVNSLIDAYAKCGNLCYAKEVFDDVEDMKRDLYSWTVIISGFAIHGRGLDCLNLFSRMEQAGRFTPDSVTFLVILFACSQSGLVEEGLRIFESMTTRYRIKPSLRHYGCIVDLLGRAGMLEQAHEIVENMSVEPNLAILGSLLSACRLQNNLELGEAVLRKIDLQERGGSTVILSNMYANENEWNKVALIRKEMRGVMQEKPPGRSLIVVKDVVHEFVAGNKITHQEMELQISLEGLENLTKSQ
ncbi:pentatricopeptide repeat-containing protein At5g66520-like [Primulina huaijiensis]|uniref:pentatricopeptide repeat-containing protein At5g66520-like n=1 Tax=Primulina huaijiensis TaxID=1492673 RepID=UPI003CC71840